jgi:hypothetical protein
MNISIACVFIGGTVTAVLGLTGGEPLFVIIGMAGVTLGVVHLIIGILR